jgi:membrane protease YdiL (CAAX protease family)
MSLTVLAQGAEAQLDSPVFNAVWSVLFLGGLGVLSWLAVRRVRGKPVLGERAVKTWTVDGVDLAVVLAIGIGGQILVFDVVRQIVPGFDPTRYGTLIVGGPFFLAVAWVVDSYRNRHGASAAQFGLDPAAIPRGLWTGLLGYVGVLPVMLGGAAGVQYLMKEMGHTPEMQEVMRQILQPDGPPWLRPLNIVYAAIGAPIVEEIVFRGVLMRYVKKLTTPWVAIAISAVLFGLVHGQLLPIVVTGILGVALGVVFERTGNLWSCIVLHMANNVMTLAIQLVLLPKAM